MNDWQPIETAPTYESVFIYIPCLAAQHYGDAIYRAIQIERGGPELRVWKVTGLHCGSEVQKGYEPSHWMPLPAPPTANEEVFNQRRRRK